MIFPAGSRSRAKPSEAESSNKALGLVDFFFIFTLVASLVNTGGKLRPVEGSTRLYDRQTHSLTD